MNDNLRLYRQVFDQLYGASRSLFRTHIHHDSGSFALHVELEVHWLAFTTCLCNLYLWTLMLTGPGTSFFFSDEFIEKQVTALAERTKSTDEWQGP